MHQEFTASVSIGQKFSRWTVIAESGRTPSGGRKWLCQCDCGKENSIAQPTLLKGTSRSCGCLQKDVASRQAKTHGLTGSPEHVAWAAMIQRCENPNNPEFHRYGERGITVCCRWRQSFEAFYADMGPRPSNKHSIDRENNHGNYEPGNCRWTTIDVQTRNTRRNVYLTHQGLTLTVKDWAKHLGISYQALQHRIKRGWTVERALGESVDVHQKRDLTFRGETMSTSEWGRRLGIDPETIRQRILRGLPVEEILAPVKDYNLIMHGLS